MIFTKQSKFLACILYGNHRFIGKTQIIPYRLSAQECQLLSRLAVAGHQIIFVDNIETNLEVFLNIVRETVSRHTKMDWLNQLLSNTYIIVLLSVSKQPMYTHYVVEVCPLGSTDHPATDAYPSKSNSYYTGDFTRRLVSIAEDYVGTRIKYADVNFTLWMSFRRLLTRD